MNDSQKIGIGIAGLGRIGWDFHAKSLKDHPDFKLVAVADPQAERRAQAETELGCRSYADYSEMICNPDISAVVIATPTHLHHNMSLQAFAKGLHVILEKPMALNSREATEITAAAHAANCKLTVYQPHRLASYYRHLLQLIDSGKIGKVYWAQIGTFNFARRNDWQSLQKFGGGMLVNYGAHSVDQILGLLGTDIKRLFCDLQCVATLGDADDVVKIVIENTAGVIGQVDISMASALSPYKVTVWGTCGTINFKGNIGNGQFELRYFDPSQLPDKQLNESLASEGRLYPYDPIEFTEEVIPLDNSLGINIFSDFARAVRTDTSPIIPPEETVAVMETLDRCRENSAGIEDMRL